MKMSIAVPTWESYGKGNEFLDDLFRTLEIQTFQDFEVVVSDHSKDDKLVDVIDEFQHKFNILYVKNKNDRGNGPANTNNAIDKCSHTQDDGRSFYWEMYPRWNDKLLEGVNSISSPSVLAFKNNVTRRFDTKLTYFMDVEFYYGMKEDYGDPILYNDVLISNRVGEYSVTTNVSHKNRDYYVREETKYCKEKYGVL